MQFPKTELSPIRHNVVNDVTFGSTIKPPDVIPKKSHRSIPLAHDHKHVSEAVCLFSQVESYKLVGTGGWPCLTGYPQGCSKARLTSIDYL